VRPDRKRVLFLVILAIGATAAAVLLIGRAARYASLIHRLRGASPEWLAVCGLGEAAAYVGYIACYQAVAQVSGGPRLTAPILARVVGLSFGAYSVATVIGGLSVDFWALREAGEPTKLASARVIALETLRWAVLGVAVCIAAILVLLGVGRSVPLAALVAWLVLVPVCFAGGLWISASRRRERFTQESGGRLRRALAVAVTALVYIRQLMTGRPGLRLRALAGAVVFWAGDVLCSWAALRAFGTRVGIAPLLIGYATGYVSVGLPLPAGGSGGVDAAMTGGFVLAGAPLSSALLGALAFRLFSFWIPALIALASVVTVHGLRERLREVAARRQGSVSVSPADGPAPDSPDRSQRG
jgi:uncharacterized membrane protein YbhN (UPF0104 family)